MIKEYDGTEGQDRENYSDDQDRESYSIDPQLEENEKVIQIVDPPEGWKYGFPRSYDIKDSETNEEWFLSKGYPQHLIDQGMLKHCRYWNWSKTNEL